MDGRESAMSEYVQIEINAISCVTKCNFMFNL